MQQERYQENEISVAWRHGSIINRMRETVLYHVHEYESRPMEQIIQWKCPIIGDGSCAKNFLLGFEKDIGCGNFSILLDSSSVLLQPSAAGNLGQISLCGIKDHIEFAWGRQRNFEIYDDKASGRKYGFEQLHDNGLRQ